MPETKVSLLVVDDEPSIRISLSQIFAAEGHRVRCASEGFSALAEIRREIPEMLISDLNMPGMSGFELLSVVRRRFPEIQVIAMSGAYSGPEVPSGVAADAFFQKGGGVGPLLRIMRSLPRPERVARQPHAEPSPVWISKYRSNAAGKGYVILECPECLGTFPRVLDGAINPVNKTECLYCGGLIRYAVTQPEDQAILQRFLSLLQHRNSAPAPALQPTQRVAP